MSSTVKDLIAGSAVPFEDRGEHGLKGVPGAWHLYAMGVGLRSKAREARGTLPNACPSQACSHSRGRGPCVRRPVRPEKDVELAADLEQLLRRRSRLNSMYLAAPALDGLRPCFLCGGSPGSDALAVVDVHEPSEQRSSVRPVGPPLKAVTHRESLMRLMGSGFTGPAPRAAARSRRRARSWPRAPSRSVPSAGRGPTEGLGSSSPCESSLGSGPDRDHSMVDIEISISRRQGSRGV